MAKRLSVIGRLRPRIASQGVVDLEKMAGRVAKNTTFNQEEIYSILRLCRNGILEALQAGETVKIDDLLILFPNMKLGGAVDLSVRAEQPAVAALNNPKLWTADKVINYANLKKSSDELVGEWNYAHPDDPVVD